MYQLAANKNITYNMISFNMRSEYGISSYIKFGGYDTIGMKGNTTDSMNMYRTTNEKKWMLPIESLKFANNTADLRVDGLQNLEIDPAVPYIYIPARQMTRDNIVKPIESKIKLPEYAKSDCDSESFCFWNTTCSSIKEKLDNYTDFINFNLKDEDGKMQTLNVPLWGYLIDFGELKTGDAKNNNSCALGMFKSNTNDAGNIIVGYQFLKEYYAVFDASNYETNNYLQIGLAPRNKMVDVGQVRYEPNFIDYQRADRLLDSSAIMDGFKDQYDMIPNPSPDVKPTYPDDPDNVDPTDPTNKGSSGIHGW